jgi:transcriptional regulator with XRE-family HTH domain
MMPLPFVPVSDRTFPVFGKKLAQARTAAGLSQAELGTVIGRSPSGVYKMESQYIANVFHRVRGKLATALKLSDDDFTRLVCVPPASVPAAFVAERMPEVLAAVTALINHLERRDPINPKQLMLLQDAIAEMRTASYRAAHHKLINPLTPAAAPPAAPALRRSERQRRRRKRPSEDGKAQG